ncbi:hypothetical protein CR203_18000 [Salipaludibacillus neizhouensis]|uniref:YolD-like family protein n=1 Tax=Salipaludibacillus neizhouensis TaxID=885475 RepID=A0A3A9KEM3_9BACI|nr:YolD-like family protein [Salipaludibacillus neizhouensis]RKL65965.1 hypothetical protein CR203_18000 [Salipaludibacillus neizhouensis]
MSDYIKRGNLMWEGSRMMLPEHIQALRNRNREVTKDPKPNLNDYELTELGFVAMESLNYTIDVRIIYWNNGYDTEISGVIDHIDHQLHQLKISGEWIKINDLKSMERIE